MGLYKDDDVPLPVHSSAYPPSPPPARWAGGSGSGTKPLWPYLKYGALALLCFVGGLQMGKDRTFTTPVSVFPTVALDLDFLRLSPYAPLPSGYANLRTLTHDQCDAAFPLLWPEVNRTVEMFENRPRRKGITLADIEEVNEFDGSRVAVVDGQMYVKRWNPESKRRSEAILASLQTAIKTSPEPFPDVEFVFRCTDNLGTGARFGLTKQRGEEMWLLPDFGFESWPEPRVLGWQDARRKAMEIDSTLTWRDKETKLFWRGAYLGAPLREQLGELAAKQSWGDVGTIDWGAGAVERINMEDHCRKKFLADVDSHSYSGRLKYILLCRSVVVSHNKRWIQHFHGALDGKKGSPTQNWVELEEENWKGLEGEMERLIADEADSERIAQNGIESLRDRYLTPASIACYWRRILKEYAALQRFTPTRGGIDFESFNLMREIDFAPH
ncbi:hypothetical protein JCM8547_000827 [Rhodosporidiobolus lusitaniae]